MAEKIQGGAGTGKALREMQDTLQSVLQTLDARVGKANKITYEIDMKGVKDIEKATAQIDKLQTLASSKINFGSLSELSTLLRDMKDNGLDMSQFKKEINTVKSSIKDISLSDVNVGADKFSERISKITRELNKLQPKFYSKEGDYKDNERLQGSAQQFYQYFNELYKYVHPSQMGIKNTEGAKAFNKYRELANYIKNQTPNDYAKKGLNPVGQPFDFDPGAIRQAAFANVDDYIEKVRTNQLKEMEAEFKSYLPARGRKSKLSTQSTTPTPVQPTGSEAPAQQFTEAGQAAEEATSNIQKFIDAYNEAVSRVGKQGSFKGIFQSYIDAINNGDIDESQKALEIFPQLEKYKNLERYQQRSFSRGNRFIDGESIHDLMATIPELHGYLTEIGYDFEKNTISAKEFFETKGLPSQQKYRVDALSQLGEKYKDMQYDVKQDIDFAFLQDVVSQMDLAEDKQTVVESMFKKIRSLREDIDNGVEGASLSDIGSQISDVSNILSPDYTVSQQELQAAKEYLGIKEKINQENTETSQNINNSGLLAQEETLQSVLQTVNTLNEALSQLQSIFASVTPESYVQQFESFRATLEGLNASLPTLTSSLERLSGLKLNLNISGPSPIERNAAYGSSARQTIGQLREQQSQLMDFYKDYYKTADSENGAFQALRGTGIKFDLDLFSGFADTGSLSSRMDSLNNLIKMLKQQAAIKNIDISSITDKFTDAGDLVNKTKDILTGKGQSTNDSFGLGSLGEEIKSLNTVVSQIKEQFSQLQQGGGLNIKDINVEQVSGALEKMQTSAANFNGKSIQGLSEFFTQLSQASKSADKVFNLAVALETLGTAIGELANTKGFNETLTPINELLKNAEQLKNLSTIVSASTSKIKQTQEQAIGKEYSSKDYINDIKNYYKYLEKAKTQELKGSEDKDSQFLVDQYHQKTLQYAEQINEKRRQGVELTDDELKAFETRTNAQKKYLENIDKVRARQEEIQKSQKEKAINEYMKNTGTDTAVRSAQNLIKQNIDNEDTAIQGQVTKLRDLINSLEKEVGELNTKFEGATIPDSATAGVDKLRRDIKAASQELREMVSGQNIKMADENLVSRLQANIANWVNANPKALKAYGDEIKNIQNTLSGDNLELDQFKAASKQFDEIKVKANEANNVGKTFSDTLKGSFGNLARYLMTFASFYQVINVFKQAVGVVKELDSALTEMRKVSDESISSLKQYQLDTFNMADKVGTTAQQIQNSTADWLRLGKSFKDAQELAMQSTVLLNVSEFTDIQQATDQLVSATQAYDELDASAITDKLNIIGNNFAVGTSDLASGLQNAAAVLKTQGNDIDQAVALLTTGNLIGQDMSKQSAGIRTISLRIAGTKEQKQEIQDMGEDVDDFVVRTQSKTDQIIRNYTAVQSNAYKGVSVLDENGNLRSTYDINYCVHIQETYMLN